MTESYSTLAAEGTKVIQPLEALACAATCFDLTIEAAIGTPTRLSSR